MPRSTGKPAPLPAAKLMVRRAGTTTLHTPAAPTPPPAAAPRSRHPRSAAPVDAFVPETDVALASAAPERAATAVRSSALRFEPATPIATPITLRDYQEQQIEKILAARAAGRDRVYVRAP